MRFSGARIAIWLGWALLSGGMGCCPAGSFRTFQTITISLDDSLRDARNTLPHVAVNIIAVNSQDLPVWKKMAIPQYFGSPRQSDAIFIMSLGEGQQSISISTDDKDPAKRKEAERIWDAWANIKPTHLVVLCDFPPPANAVSPEDDPRRAILPITCEWWPRGQKEIRLKITTIGLSVLTPPIPPN